jgi:two-component system sensor histidine kinase/response regulator
VSAATPYFISWELIYFKTMMHDLPSAIHLDQIARSLCETPPFKAVHGNVLVHYTCFLQSNLEPLRATLPTFMQAYQICRESGDTDYCGYITATYLEHALFAGSPIQDAIRTGFDLSGFYKTVDMPSQKKTTYAVLSGIQSLATYPIENPDQWKNDFFNDDIDIPIMEKGSDFLGLCFVYSTKILIAQLFRNKASVDRYFTALAPYQQSAASFYMEYWLPFAQSLHLIEGIASDSTVRERVDQTLQMLKDCAVHAPMNFQHKYDLLLAEKYRVTGLISDALLAYGRAIRGAEDAEYWNEAGHSCELAAEACLSIALAEPVNTYLHRAVVNYQKWGAIAKVHDLLKRYPDILLDIQVGDVATISGAAIDLESIVLASQVMISETTTAGLYRRMLNLLMKNSGADRCLFLYCDKGAWRIEAHADSETPAMLEGLPYPQGLDSLPASRWMLDYVLRTSEPLIVADAIKEERFSNDPHILSGGARSVLCLPLVQQGEIRGLLYHENHHVPGVFSKARLRVITVIANQFQIALENAFLLEGLEKRVQERTRELHEARDAAEAANKAKSNFLATMSHELRTPLNAILGFSEILAKDSEPGSRAREHLATIRRSGEHLLTIINDILDLSKIESGKMEFQPQPFDLGELITDLTVMFHQQALEKGLSLTIDQSSSFPRFVKSDPAKLKQIFVNLIGNAIKYTDRGGIRIKLCTASVRNGTDHHQIIGEVIDTGMGIAQEDFQRIMDPFVQIGTHEGTGLGLTITQQLVKLMEGELKVTSQLGKGSTFQFIVAYEPVLENDLPVASKKFGDVSGIANAGEFRILIVEDQMDNRRLLRSILEPFGFSIREAENGRIGVDCCQEWHPHLIFLDRRMPIMDGIEAAQEIRSLDASNNRPVLVAVTAHAFRDEEQEMRDAGCDDFIAKPYTISTILQALENHLPLAVVRRSPELTIPSSNVKPSQSAMAALPIQIRRELEDALEIGSAKSIEDVIEQVIELNPSVGGWMLEKARRLDYGTLITVLNSLENNQ